MIINADALNGLKTIKEESIDTCITSPPYYGLRDYGVDEQIGLEKTPNEYIQRLIQVFREVRRVLKDDGTLWVNIGDSYAGSGKGSSLMENSKQSTNRGSQSVGKLYGVDDETKEYRKKMNVGSKTFEGIKAKDLIGIPWMLAFALRADGWYLRQDIIWHKPNPMPESVTDRCTKAHEYIFLLSKSAKYYFDNEAIKEPATSTDAIKRNRDATKLNNTPGRSRMEGLVKNDYTTRNRRSVWTVTTKPFKKAHFAVFPPDLIEPCILAGSRLGGFVLDPFCGSGTTCITAHKAGRRYIGIDLNPEYCTLSEKRIINYCFLRGGGKTF